MTRARECVPSERMQARGGEMPRERLGDEGSLGDAQNSLLGKNFGEGRILQRGEREATADLP